MDFPRGRHTLSIDIVGWVALVLTQVFWIPNITRIVRTRDVDGYSLFAWIIMVAGLSCWLVYFAVQGDVVGVVANIFGVTGAGVTTLLIWLWKRPARPEVVLAGSLTVDQG